MQVQAIERPRRGLLLVLLFLWAVALRVTYASHELHVGRFWDEKQTIPNVHQALERGSLRPVHFGYPRLSYLPHVAVLWGLERIIELGDPDFSWFSGRTLRPPGFLVARSVQALLGGLSLGLTFLVGRRIFSPPVGLLGAFLLACFPIHLISSAYFKPDIPLVAATLAAFLWSLRAVERPDLQRYLLAGLGVGLALACKPTGGVIALPLTLAALALGWRDRRHWLGLVWAGVTSVVVFFAFNPYVEYLHSFRWHLGAYEAASVEKGAEGSPLTAMWHILDGLFLGHPGPWIGLAAAAGMLLTAARAWRLRGEPERAVPLAMLVSFPLVYTPLFSLVTQHVSGNSLLLLLPFVALAAAFLLHGVWRLGTTRSSWLADGRVAVAVVAILVALTAHRVHARTYQRLVPRTVDLALRALAGERPAVRSWVYWEAGATAPPLPREPGRPRPYPKALLLWDEPRLSEVETDRLAASDAELFPLSRLEGADGRHYRSRMELGEEVSPMVVRPAPFRAWGPAVVVVRHPWRRLPARDVTLERLAGPDSPAARQGAVLGCSLAPADGGAVLAAVRVVLPGRAGRKRAPEIAVAGQRVGVAFVASTSRGRVWLSDRFRIAREMQTGMRVRLPPGLGAERLEATVLRWAKAEAAP